ncbi:MAG: DUF885 family protein [Fimbriimonadaceae bacterium]|nr:DUF885 family protein [Fimbriimonadaceae bacterium]
MTALGLALLLQGSQDRMMPMHTELTQPGPVMPQVMNNYQADLDALGRTFRWAESPRRVDRFDQYYRETIAMLDRLDPSRMNRADQADWALLRHEAEQMQIANTLEARRIEEVAEFFPFRGQIQALFDERISRGGAESERSASALTAIQNAIEFAEREIKGIPADDPRVHPIRVRRAVGALRGMQRALRDWHSHFTGYDPLFTWWTARPFADTDKSLADYIQWLDQNRAGDRDPTAITGDPVGRAGLEADLEREMISLTPEQLMTIAERELVWCDAEMKKAAAEMGLRDDWRAALERTKEDHVPPGGQPDMIHGLAEEAINYLEANHLVTVPEMAKEVWRMDMMSPERQLIAPFFLGGETILVSFPTDAMTEEQKQMSMRANNIHFARATVHHELIPGHHLQGFMTQRYNTHRRGITETPFWIEGWALYWEFLLYARGFPPSPESRMGFLFWRKHRAARILFSLKYHLGQMTEQECVDMLVNEVGHERSTAEGEVRRSFGGQYPPLYQVAYMIGAIQLTAIRREVVGNGKMSEQEFHDTVLKLGNMPWAMVRAILTDRPLGREFRYDWNFDSGRPIGEGW